MRQSEGRQLVPLTVRPMNGAYHLSWPKGQHSARLSREQLAQVLRKLSAKDAETTPKSKKNRTFAQMIDGFHTGTPKHCWVWSNRIHEVPDHIRTVMATPIELLEADVTISPFEIGNIASRHKVTPAEVAKMVPKAAHLTSEEFGIPPTKFGSKEQQYVVEVLNSLFEGEMKMAPKIDLKSFLESNLSTDKYLETVTTTGMTGASTLPIRAADLGHNRPNAPEEDTDKALQQADVRLTQELGTEDRAGDVVVETEGSGEAETPENHESRGTEVLV